MRKLSQTDSAIKRRKMRRDETPKAKAARRKKRRQAMALYKASYSNNFNADLAIPYLMERQLKRRGL